MSTRSSRQVKGNRRITTQEIQELFPSDSDENEENPSATLTEEQIEINKKLSDSGLLEDGLNWNEKKDLVKTLNASVSSASYERRVRSSPKPDSKERIIPIEIEEEGEIELEKGEVAFSRPNNSLQESPKTTSANKTSGSLFKRGLEAIKNNFIGIGSSSRKESEGNSQGKINSDERGNIVVNSDSKCNRINVDVKKDVKIAIDLSSDEDGETIFLPKKRPSPPEQETRVEQIKKFKMDQSTSSTKLNVSNSRRPLKTETEWAAKQNSIRFNRRSIQTILNELRRTNKLRKEAAGHYTFPVRWGNPMSRNSSERWDSQVIPQKLIDRYKKFLAKNPDRELSDEESPRSFFRRQIDVAAAGSSEDRSETVEDSAGNEPAIEDRTSESTLENSENVPRQSERKTKGRGGNRYKPPVTENDEFENVDEGDENDGDWVPTKEVPKKNGKSSSNKPLRNSNMKNFVEPTRRQPISKGKKPENKVDNYKFYKSKNSDDVPDGNEGEGKSDWSKREPHQISNFDDSEEIGGTGDDEQVPCPICNKSFKQNLIENHATECASKTFQD